MNGKSINRQASMMSSASRRTGGNAFSRSGTMESIQFLYGQADEGDGGNGMNGDANTDHSASTSSANGGLLGNTLVRWWLVHGVGDPMEQPPKLAT